jgi:toxin FitB
VAYLLDTNVISEQTKPSPNAGVFEWLDQHSVGETYLSVITLGEIEQGIHLLGDTKRARSFRTWLEKLEDEFAGQILDLDRSIMQTWAEMTARTIPLGRTMAYADSLIAATALRNDLVLVTRNEDDFRHAGVQLLNPWLG